MAEAELASALKDLPSRMQSASRKVRKATFQALVDVLKHPGFENVVKKLCKLMPSVLFRYEDSKSQAYVKQFLAELVKTHADAAVKGLAPVLLEVANNLNSISPSKNISQTSLYALDWTCILLSAPTLSLGPDFAALIKSQALFLCCIVGGGSEAAPRKAQHLLSVSWKRLNKDDLCVEQLIEISKSDDANIAYVVYASFLSKHFSDVSQNAKVASFKTPLLDTFVKSSVTCKQVARLDLVTACAPFLRHLTHEDLSGTLLPALQRSLLRSPETVLTSIACILGAVSLDLSQYVEPSDSSNITKSLSSLLYSKQEDLRTAAAGAIKSVSQQCSNATAVEKLLLHLFGILQGSEGKLSTTDLKMNVLQGIGNLCTNAVTGSSVHQLSCKAADNFIKVLDSEIHEGTLIKVLEMYSLWCGKFANTVPKDVVEWFVKGPELKTSTSAVRTAYIECMLVCFHGNTLGQAEELIGSLLKRVEKAAAQPTQPAVVTEGLAAACLVLKLAAADACLDSKLNSFWPLVYDMERQVFLSEKFLAQSSAATLVLVAQLCERLLSAHRAGEDDELRPVQHALLYCMTHQDAGVRHKSRVMVRRLVQSLGGVKLACRLLERFAAFLESLQSDGEVNSVDTGGGGVDGKGVGGEISAKVHVDCILAICSGSAAAEDAAELALSALLCCHNQLVVTADPRLWLKLLRHANVDPEKFVEANQERLKTLLVDNFENKPSHFNALKTVISVGWTFILPGLVDKCLRQLEDSALLTVSQVDYQTYLTPEGELFDKSVASADSNDGLMNAKNMKRESKAYSYKEQVEEMQLRKELAEKRKKQGLKVEPELSQKQKEAIRLQLEKESAVRSRLFAMNASLQATIAMVDAAVEGQPDAFSFYFKDLIPALLQTLQSHLASESTHLLFLRLGRCVFGVQQRTLNLLVAYTLLRLHSPKCALDEAWQQEELSSAVQRTISLLDKLVSGGKKCLSAPAFCYSFPLIRAALLSASLGIRSKSPNENLIVTGLHFISEHAKMRKAADGADILRDPTLLPRKNTFDLLIDIIGETSGRLQLLACNTLIDVATSGSGNVGCARAREDEIRALMSALQSPQAVIRDSAIRALLTMEKALPGSNDPLALDLQRRLFIALYDICKENREPAEQLWKAAKIQLDHEKLCPELLKDVTHPVEDVQMAAAEALAELLKQRTCLLDGVLQELLVTYEDKLTMTPPQLDDFGRVVVDSIDHWEPRKGVAQALQQLAPLLTPVSVSELAEFYVSTGLMDRNEAVRKAMLASALAAVDLHGKETVGSLLPTFEEFLDKAPNSSTYDAVRQSVVILMGSLARHLELTDPRIKPIVHRLLNALTTPSQQVQEAVANCLPPLMQAVSDDAADIVKGLLRQLLESDKYGERKGAAYGLAGVVKGLGILALKQLEIMATLTEAIQDKKSYQHREGALFAFEMLCSMLGRLFEPYIVHVLPHLLLCFGDPNQYVREATDETAKVVMSRLSAHGVKLVLPSLLAALEEDSWRTKTGSVELLGAMAFCAPKQLSSCLPNIVPKLIEVLSDSHVKVQKAGAQALGQIGSVIRNPEIQAIVPVLLEALQDPAKKTATSLQTLLETQFVHFIDAPSLALIMPVVQRAFQDRSTETRKMAAQIIGNMYSLTAQKDLMPYLPTIIPGLKMSLLDPVPEVRSVSARALGAMVRGMGESSFEELLPWLMETLTSESSSVDRSGAAQGLSEVVGGLGVDKLHKLMPEIIATAERNDIAPHVKDGYIMMFIYMPVAFPKEFTPYIGEIINPILKALADENEYVRDTALKAGQRIVNLYADTAIMLLLPQLEQGLFDDNWRIRYSSVQLLGDLLYKISGVSGKMSTETADEDDNFGTEQSHSAIIDALGGERRNRVLAGLYMGRSDVALMVRQAALHVWKVVVTNTPRTLREILPTLFGLLLGCLASTSYDKRQVAARTLGDLVRKLGERVLPEIIPILERGLESDQPDQRQGVCIGLSEIMASTSRDMVLTFVNSLVPTVRKALCDPLPEVRQAAAKTFDSLHSTVGARALDDILPAMLHQLSDPELAEYTLDGLRQVMAIKSRVVLPYLVPQLTAPPKANTKALSILASVAGEALTKYLHRILPALLTALADAQGTPNEAQELEYCQAVILSVTDEAGVRTVMDQLMEATKSDKAEVRRSAATLLCAFCSNSRADYSQYVPQLLRGLIHLFTDQDKDVLQMSWEALNAVTKTLDPAQQLEHVGDIRQAVRFTLSDLKGQQLLPGFCLPKGITPILPIFREAILNGPPELKEQAAQGLGEVIKLTSAEALQPSVVHITGPLIRILGDRFNWNVKAAVLETLALLLAKVGLMLKQFLPQLQTTFLKALNDSNRQVRLKAACALSHLIVIHTRADPLFLELHNGVKNADDPGIRETTLHALRGVISPAGEKMTDPLKKAVFQTLTTMLSHPEDTTRSAAAGCLGALCRWLSKEKLNELLTERLLVDDASTDWTVRHGRSAAVFVCLKESPESIYTEEHRAKVERVLGSYLAADRVPIVMNGVRGCGYLLVHMLTSGTPVPVGLVQPLARTMNHASNEVKQLLARVTAFVARSVTDEQMQPELLRMLIPTLVNGTKEKNSVVKANSELALVAVLRLRTDPQYQQRCLEMLDIGARESLADVISKVLRKIANQPEGKDEELDDTLLV
ncbi:stalled ribosome sensor GCN1 isoform X1 [Cloeon dipterum]|uniref:stalled ribosome sensor GCN1 isoform X1 n=2 Tax=Cloeon dipterum TaxID=197152 RepID=UPI00321FA1DB